MDTPEASGLPPERIRGQLLLRQAELRLRLQGSAEAAVRAVEQPADASDFMALADTGAEQAVRDAATHQAMRELAAIAAALQRVADGTYGICETCGEPIAPARLRALPATLRCAACQTASERRATGA